MGALIARRRIGPDLTPDEVLVRDEIAWVGLVGTFNDDTKGDLQGQCRSETQGSADRTAMRPVGSLSGYAKPEVKIRLDELYLPWPRLNARDQLTNSLSQTIIYHAMNFRLARKSEVIVVSSIAPCEQLPSPLRRRFKLGATVRFGCTQTSQVALTPTTTTPHRSIEKGRNHLDTIVRQTANDLQPTAASEAVGH